MGGEFSSCQVLATEQRQKVITIFQEILMMNFMETVSERLVKRQTHNIYTQILVHYFDYTDDPFNHTFYPIPRFISAYGHQSLPNTETILNQVNNDYYLNFTKDWLTYRQHQSEGYDEMMTLLTSNLEMTNINNSMYYLQFFFYTEVSIFLVSDKH